MNKPLLIVVTGCPGSGKTTLAHVLAKQVHCPALCRDEFKEGLVNTLEGSHDTLNDDVNRRVYETFFQVVELMASNGISLVIEAAFQHKLWAPKLEPLQDLSRMSLVICTVDPLLARSRFIERSLTDPARKRFHGDRFEDAEKTGSQPSIENYDPPRLSTPTLSVDTTDGYRPGLEAIVSFAMRS
jgi:predicted kinase